MPTQLKREDDIDSAYDYSPTAQRLANSENATNDSYVNAGTDQLEAFANDPNNASDSVRARETSADDANGGWTVNRSAAARALEASQNPMLKVVKKNGPMGLIIGLLVSGGFGMSVLFSPGILLVHLKEALTNKFNSQETSMTVRYRKMLVQKLVGDNGGATKGACGSLTIRCKYNRMSNKMLQNLDEAGVKSFNGNTETKKTGTLGERPTRFEFTDSMGRKISVPASELSNALDNNPEFSAAFKKAFNPRYAGFADSIFNNIMAKFKISKSDDLEGKSTDEMKKQIQTDVNDGKVGAQASDGISPKDSSQAAKDAANAEQASSSEASQAMASEAEALAQNGKVGESVVKNLMNGSKTGGLAGLGAAVICMGTQLPKTLGKAVRLVQETQLIRYAMIFLVVADKIKAGNATPEEVTLLGDTLTTVLKDNKGNITKAAATDGFGMGYALFGDLRTDQKGKPNVSSYTNFVPGGGWSKKLEGFSNAIGGNSAVITQGCDFVNSTGGQILMGVLGGWTGILTTALSLTAGGLIEDMLAPLITKLVNAMAGKMVDDMTKGQDAGDAYASGASNMLAETAAAGGNAPLTVNQALAYNNVSSDIQLANAREDRVTHSPFDASNPNTFLGSITTNLIPYANNFSSIFGMMSFATDSIGSALPILTGAKTFADTNNERTALTMCDDPNLKETGVAAGPFCNVSYGVPPQYMQATPEQVLDSLAGQYDDTTGDPVPGSDLDNWITKCTKGSSNGDDVAGLKDCIIDSQQKANYSLFFIDRRVQKGMDEEDTPVASTSPSEFTVASYNLLHATSHPADSKKIGNCPTAGDSAECIKLRSDRQIQIIQGLANSGSPAFDIVGTQETSPAQYEYIKQNMPSYSVYPDTSDGMNNSTHGAVAVWWNKSKFTEFESGHAPGVSNTAKDITYPWVGLQDTGGHKVYVMSIHYANSTFGGTAADIKRSSQLTMDWVKSKVSDTSQVIVMGDFNDEPKQKLSYCVYTQNSLMQHVSDMENNEDPSNACPNPNSIHGIDHIYVTPVGGVQAKGWKHMDRSGVVSLASDHEPVYSTINLPGSDATGGAAAGAGDDVPAKFKQIATACLDATGQACSGSNAWLGMLPGQCASFAAWRAAQEWYGSKLAKDGSNLEQLVTSHPMIPGRTLNLGNGNQVASTLINAHVADRVASLAQSQPGDIVSMAHNSWGHVYVILSNNNGDITIEDYNAAGGPGRYGTKNITGNNFYSQANVIAIARMHKDGGAK